jgi:hypothetical protein
MSSATIRRVWCAAALLSAAEALSCRDERLLDPQAAGRPTGPPVSPADGERLQTLVTPIEDLMVRVVPTLGDNSTVTRLEASLLEMRTVIIARRNSEVRRSLDRAESLVTELGEASGSAPELDVIVHTLREVEAALTPLNAPEDS